MTGVILKRRVTDVVSKILMGLATLIGSSSCSGFSGQR